MKPRTARDHCAHLPSTAEPEIINSLHLPLLFLGSLKERVIKIVRTACIYLTREVDFMVRSILQIGCNSTPRPVGIGISIFTHRQDDLMAAVIFIDETSAFLGAWHATFWGTFHRSQTSLLAMNKT